VAGAVPLIYDHLLTLEWEVQFYLQGRWGLVRVAFILCRYLPYPGLVLGILADLFQSVSDGTHPHSSPATLNSLQTYGNVIRVGAILMTELLLNIRIWALWAKNKRVLAVLLILAGVALPIGLYLNLTHGLLVNAVLMTYELALLLLVLLRRRELRETLGALPRSVLNNRRPIVELLIEDGVLYVLAIVAILATIIIGGYTLGTHAYGGLFNAFQLAIQSSMSCRSILHIIENDQRRNELTTSLEPERVDLAYPSSFDSRVETSPV